MNAPICPSLFLERGSIIPAMPTIYLKSKQDYDAELKRLAELKWTIYLTYQADDGSWVIVAFDRQASLWL